LAEAAGNQAEAQQAYTAARIEDEIAGAYAADANEVCDGVFRKQRSRKVLG